MLLTLLSGILSPILGPGVTVLANTLNTVLAGIPILGGLLATLI